MTKTPLIFPLLLILLSSAIIPYSYASVDSEAQEDILAGCRDGQTMDDVFGITPFVFNMDSLEDFME